MALNTEYLNLIKPSQDDFYNIEDFNNNFDIIDTNIKDIKNIENQINNNVSRNTSNISTLQNNTRILSGTWTPRMYAGSFSLPTGWNSCKYKRQGDFIILYLDFSANMTSISSSYEREALRLEGVPYSANTNNGSFQNIWFSGTRTNNENDRLFIKVSGTSFYFYRMDINGTTYLNRNAFKSASSSTTVSGTLIYTV